MNVGAPKEISEEVSAELDDLSFRYDVTEWQSALLRNCKIEE
jgi:hypothetical protein